MAKPKTYTCEECGKVYKTERGFNTHASLVHAIPDKVKDVVQDINVYTQPIQQDAKKPIGKYVFGGIALLAIVAIIWQRCNSNAVQENEKKIATEQARIDSLQVVIDSLAIEKVKADSIAIIALDMAVEAEQNSKQKTVEYETSKREGRELRESSQAKFNELKKVIADPSIDKRAAIEQVLRANRQVNTITGHHDR